MEMRRLDPTLRLILVGDGPARKDLQQTHPEIIFAGMQRGEALARHYASGDIFLFPSTTETFGNVILEAMASGLAIVTYDYAAGREYLLHGKSGLLADFDAPGDFVAQARSLARKKETVKRLSTCALETAKKCTWDNVINDLEGIYDIIVA
jgi:glycosyltransferase involved in cell wall biosynthesis